MQAPALPNQSSEDNTELTSYWLSQNPAAFLMHLRELSCRIDQNSPEHAELRSYIKTYLQTVERLEISFLEGEHEKEEVDKQAIATLEKKVKELSGEVDELTAKLMKTKLTLINSQQRKDQLNKALLQLMCKIYNPLVETFNKTIVEVGQRNPHEDWSQLQIKQTEDTSKIRIVCSLLSQHKKDLQYWIRSQKEKGEELNKKKDKLKKQIVGVYENIQGNLFIHANRRYEQTSKTLERINEGQKQMSQLDNKIKQLSENKSRKIANTMLYRQGISMMSKPSENCDETFSTEGSIDLEIQKTKSEPIQTNPQIVFLQEQPKAQVRVLLGVWAAALAVGTMVLAFT